MDTPQRYREHLARLGGYNQYGEPLYQLVWGANQVPRPAGFPQVFLMPNEALARSLQCWVLCEWKSAEEFGDPAQYEVATEYGLFIPLQVFREDGESTQLDSETLNLNVLELFMWVILNHKNDNLQKRQGFLKDEQAKIDVAKRQALVDRIEDGAPAFSDACSFSGQLNVNSAVKQKMEILEKNLTRIQERAAQFSRGGIQQQSA